MLLLEQESLDIKEQVVLMCVCVKKFQDNQKI